LSPSPDLENSEQAPGLVAARLTRCLPLAPRIAPAAIARGEAFFHFSFRDPARGYLDRDNAESGCVVDCRRNRFSTIVYFHAVPPEKVSLNRHRVGAMG
jgi:hypothetical protein